MLERTLIKASTRYKQRHHDPSEGTMLERILIKPSIPRELFSSLFFCLSKMVLLWVFLQPMAAAISTADLSLEQERRYHDLLTELRCLVCQNQSLAESDAGLAVDLREVVKTMLMEGADDDEIFKFMSERYGDFVLYRPPLKPQNYILWGAPFLLLVIGLTILMRRVARQARAREHSD